MIKEMRVANIDSFQTECGLSINIGDCHFLNHYSHLVSMFDPIFIGNVFISSIELYDPPSHHFDQS